MTKTRKKFTMAVGIAVGVTVLAGAAFASYSTSNGYEVGKTAIKGLMQNENYTADSTIRLLIDGNDVSTTEIKELYDRNGDVVLNRFEKSTTSEYYSYYMGSSDYKNYVQDNQNISIYTNPDGERSASVYNNETYTARGAFDSMYGIDDKDKETANKIIRFAELVGDTLVGDLKNNIVYVSGEDNISTYELNLDTMQIPEMVNAGISAMFSSMNSYSGDLEDPFLVFGTDPIIKNAYLKFSVDSEGRLSDVFASATLSGNGHEGSVEVSLNIYDYGTTKPERIDVSTIPNVSRYDFDDEIGRYTVESADYVTPNGAVLDGDGNAVGHIEIDPDTGEGNVVIGGADTETSITVTK